MNQTQLTDVATRYAAAWSSQNPASLASFYTENGSLTVNGGAPSVGRPAITETVRGFMTAFPDMVVKLDQVRPAGSRAIFRWTWTGTNTGPGGTGNSVRISGYEEWTIGADGLIADSKGHFDEAEYQRQLKSGDQPSRTDSPCRHSRRSRASSGPSLPDRPSHLEGKVHRSVLPCALSSGPCNGQAKGDAGRDRPPPLRRASVPPAEDGAVRLRPTASAVRPLRAIEGDAGFGRPSVAKPILNCERAGLGIHRENQYPRRIV